MIYLASFRISVSPETETQSHPPTQSRPPLLWHTSHRVLRTPISSELSPLRRRNESADRPTTLAINFNRTWLQPVSNVCSGTWRRSTSCLRTFLGHSTYDQWYSPPGVGFPDYPFGVPRRLEVWTVAFILDLEPRVTLLPSGRHHLRSRPCHSHRRKLLTQNTSVTI